MNIISQQTWSAILFAGLMAAIATPIQAGNGPDTSREKEKELLAVLRSDAPGGEKAIACKNLAIHGSSEAVSELAKLLPDVRFSSWARIALEAIPGAEADSALRAAADTLEGRLLIGAINSIAVRRDTAAVDSLTAKLQHADTDVASAAAVALGRIGNAAATTSLRAVLSTASSDVRSAVAEGCVLCAERLHSEGSAAAAAEIYDEVRNADVPMQRIIEATRGAILAQDQEGIPLLIEILRSQDKKLFQLALGTTREFPGDRLDTLLAAQTAIATPDRAALMIQAMADRTDTVDVEVVLDFAAEGPKEVRLSAINALDRVGNDSCLASLLEIAAESDAELAQAAKDTVAGLPGDDIDSQIVHRLQQAGQKSDPLMLELVGRRRIKAVKDIVGALEHSDQIVRSTALIALGETVSLSELSLLVPQVIAPKHPEDASAAQQALRAASVRMPDPDACATELAKALQQSSAGTKTVLLEILSDVGGANALQTLATAAKSNDAELQDTGSRLLGKWNGLDAAPVLLDLAITATERKYKVRGLRGYLGLARKFSRGAKRAEMCQTAIDAAIRPEEQKLALEVLTQRPDKPGLSVAIKAQKISGLDEAATEAIQIIASKLRNKGIDVSDLIAVPANN